MFKSPLQKTSRPFFAILFASTMLTACGGGSSSDSSTETEVETEIETTTMNTTNLDATDASQAAKLDLLSGHTVTDDTWHIAYQKYTGFMVNGGFSGTGEVEGCIAHQYEALFDEESVPVVSEFQSLNLENTLENYAAVDKTSCTEFTADNLKTQIETESWLDADYSQGSPIYSAKDGNGWIIRSSSKDAVSDEYSYARVKVKQVDVSFGDVTSRKVTLSVENWDTASATFNYSIDSPELDFTNDRVFYDMESNTIVTESDNWDLSIMLNGRDYPIQVNAGASGDGIGGAGVLQVASADAVTDPTDTDQVYRYFGDSVEGILSKPGSYGPLEYSVEGQHKMWPTFTTYLFKDGERYFKAQIVSNYGEDGISESANLYLRYEELID